MVERQGQDLVLKDVISLGAGAYEEPYIATQTQSLQGRQICLWGRNPFFKSAGGHSFDRNQLQVCLSSALPARLPTARPPSRLPVQPGILANQFVN